MNILKLNMVSVFALITARSFAYQLTRVPLHLPGTMTKYKGYQRKILEESRNTDVPALISVVKKKSSLKAMSIVFNSVWFMHAVLVSFSYTFIF